MNRIIILLTGILISASLFFSCKKDNINGDIKNLVEGAYLTLLSKGNSSVDYQNLEASSVTMTVGSFGVPVESVNIYAVLGSSLDASTWKLVKNVAFADSAVLTVSGKEMITALGSNAEDVNTDITLYTEAVTKDGRNFSVANTPSTYTSFTVYNFAFTWPIALLNYVCPYDQSYFDGNFLVQTDEWNDFSEGDAIAVSPGPGTNQITLTLYPAPGVGTNRKPIVADVNPATDSLTVAKQVYGDYDGDYIAAEGTGYLSACSGIISLTLKHTNAASGASYGTYKVELKKSE